MIDKLVHVRLLLTFMLEQLSVKPLGVHVQLLLSLMLEQLSVQSLGQYVRLRLVSFKLEHLGVHVRLHLEQIAWITDINMASRRHTNRSNLRNR